MFEVSRLFITGGAGFIGSNYTRWLLQETTVEHIVVYDALTYAGGLDTLKGVLDDCRVTFVRGDVCNRQAVTQAMQGCDMVVHLAAESHVDKSIANPDAFVRTNCFGTNVVCDVARRSGVKRFVHVSTDEVYGSISEGSFTEQSPLRPTSPYAASKAAADHIAQSYHRTYGLNLMLTRSSNIFGPYQFPEKVIPLFVTNLFYGEPMPLYGDGTNMRDWCYVQDNCAAIHMVLLSGEPGEVYNISSDNALTNRDLAEKLMKLCEPPVDRKTTVQPGRSSSGSEQGDEELIMGERVSHTDGVQKQSGSEQGDEELIMVVEDRLGHDQRYSLNSSKIRSLGWAPQYEFDRALAQTVEWYRDNLWWWEPRRQELLRCEP
ncbi:MAG: dTDP-glucose 4,6-dehydratase [Acidimicrobiaceae bacterium]|nr:dTDP-glucose 4,6-dehydratase [Acidimicrobiaceae bacterium]